MSNDEVKLRISAKHEEAVNSFQKAGEAAEQFGKKVEEQTKPLGQLKEAAEAVGIFMAGEFLKSTIEAAAKAEESWTLVKSSVQNTGITFKNVKGELSEAFDELAKKSRFSEQQITAAFSTLLTVTNDYGGSMKNLELVANIAVARHMDLGEAATLVGRVMDGNTSMLKRYGIVLRDDGVSPMEQLHERFKDFAENDAKSLPGQLHQIENGFEKIKEAIGDALVDGGKGGMSEFNDQLRTLGEWVKSHHDDFATLGRDIAGIVEGVGKLIGLLERIPGSHWVLNRMGDTKANIDIAEGRAFHPMEPNTTNMLQIAVQTQAEKDANAARIAAEKAADAEKKLIEELRKHLNDTDPLENNFDAAMRKNIERTQGLVNALGVTNGMHQLNVSSNVQQNILDLLNGATIRAADLNAKGATTRQERDTRGAGSQLGFDFKTGVAEAKKSLGDLNDSLLSVGRTTADVSTSAIVGFSQTWGQAIGQVITGHEKLGQAIVKSARQAVGQSLAAKGQETLLDAAKAAIEGFTNPVEFIKAAKLFALGTAELSAAASFGGGGGGGFSSPGGAINGGAFGQSQQNIQNGRGTTTIVLKGRYMDASDSEWMDTLVRSIREAGDNNIVVQNG